MGNVLFRPVQVLLLLTDGKSARLKNFNYKRPNCEQSRLWFIENVKISVITTSKSLKLYQNLGTFF